jgi:hypothetical protein
MYEESFWLLSTPTTKNRETEKHKQENREIEKEENMKEKKRKRSGFSPVGQYPFFFFLMSLDSVEDATS